MDSSDNNRSTKIPIRLTVTSELEPVECDGFYAEQSDGFVLEFTIGDDKYEIRHTDSVTRLVARGLMSYTIDFGGRNSETVVSTPFGVVNFTVYPVSREIIPFDGGFTVDLKYSISDGVQHTERNVIVAARFLR